MLTLLLAGCATPAPAPADTDTDAPLARLLEEGSWNAAIVAIENDTCGHYIEATLDPRTGLRWIDDATFTLYDDKLTQPCTVGADGAVTCEVYTWAWESGADFALSTRWPTLSFDLIAATHFERVEQMQVLCEGDGCAAASVEYRIPFPCSQDVHERYER